MSVKKSKRLVVVGEWMKRMRGSNSYATDELNMLIPQRYKIQVSQNKYLNNTVEQDHRFIKNRIKPMLGFKNFHPSITRNRKYSNDSKITDNFG